MLSRRKFLQGSALSVGAAGLVPFGARAADQSGYKALVCVNLRGGFDCHEAMIGYDQPSYDLWASARQALIDRIDNGNNPGIRSRDNLLPLNPSNAGDYGSRQFAMPGEFSELHSLFENGRLAIVPNVGPLVEPVTRSTFLNETAVLPPRLRSHNDQASTWQALGVEGTRVGWGGKILDAFTQDSPYTAVSLAGQSVFLAGNRTKQVNLPASGRVTQAFGLGSQLFGSPEVATALQNYYSNAAANATNPMMRDYIRMQGEAIDNSTEAGNILSAQTLGDSVEVNGNPLSEQLATVANLIAARDQFGVNRQVFFVELPGFDVHSNLAEQLPDRMSQVSVALANFQAALDSAGIGDMVTTFTTSEFGRTLVANAKGTDHGWGGHHFVMGGAVNGGRIYGSVPTLELDDPQVDERGSLLAQISLEQYGAEMGRWFGLTGSDLDQVFPHRNRFDTTPLGVLI